MFKFVCCFLFLNLILKGAAMSSPINKHGILSVLKNDIVNQQNEPVALRGVSSHGLQWYGKILTRNALIDLRDNWKIDVFRAAMYTVQGGYIEHPEIKQRLIEIIDDCIELGLYVIVDWHILYDNNPQIHQRQAKAFFDEISKKYANVPNLIYELCNEPNGNVSWGGNIKPYAIDIIKTIRANDKNALILVGSGSWSQNVQDPANDPLGFANIAYTLHFYAGTHGKWLRDRIDYARNKGIAIYVSEWGTTNSSGNGQLYFKESDEWLSFLKERNIGWTNWSYSNAGESSAMLTWDYKLTSSGSYVKRKLNE